MYLDEIRANKNLISDRKDTFDCIDGMNTVALYDDQYEKNPIFGAYRELHKLSIAEIIIGSIGMIISLVYWILPKLDFDLIIFGINLKVSKNVLSCTVAVKRTTFWCLINELANKRNAKIDMHHSLWTIDYGS